MTRTDLLFWISLVCLVVFCGGLVWAFARFDHVRRLDLASDSCGLSNISSRAGRSLLARGFRAPRFLFAVALGHGSQEARRGLMQGQGGWPRRASPG